MALQLCTRPYNSIICAETAHIYVDECGAPARMTGCQIRPIATPDGKLTPDLVRPYLCHFGEQHHSQPGAIYISQCSELGTVYKPDELRALTDLAHRHGMYVHMDGARLANACAALNLGFRELTVDCGIDILSFGGTKNGLMLGESVVVFNPALKKEAYFVRKQSAQLASQAPLSVLPVHCLPDGQPLAEKCRACQSYGKDSLRRIEGVARCAFYAEGGK